jgi:hypothetical protein
MGEYRLEVADVFHAHQNQVLQRWGHVVSGQQGKVVRDIGLCRTAANDECNDPCPPRFLQPNRKAAAEHRGAMALHWPQRRVPSCEAAQRQYHSSGLAPQEKISD